MLEDAFGCFGRGLVLGRDPLLQIFLESSWGSFPPAPRMFARDCGQARRRSMISHGVEKAGCKEMLVKP